MDWRSIRLRLAPVLVLLATVPAPAAAQALRFDFGPASGPLQAGYTRVTAADAYSAAAGFGFTTAPAIEVDGSSFTWNFFGRIVTVDQAIPSAVLSDATRDCVKNTRSRPFEFRADVAPGAYDVTLWLGDVTTPLFQVRATVNGVDLDVVRMDVNHTRGSFDQTEIGGSVPRTLRVDATGGFITVAVGPAPGSTGPITLGYAIPDCPTPPPGGPSYTATLVPAFAGAALQAITLHPAADPPLVLQGGTLALGSAPADPALLAALAQYNAGDIAGSRASFAALVDPALRSARANGLFWVAGDPRTAGAERALLGEARTLLEAVLGDDPGDLAAEDLLREVNLADDAERYRMALGYGGTPAAENMGRSCALSEAWPPDHPYYRKGQILWLRNRGGLDPRRCTVSWARARDLALSLDPQWGALNPYVHLYATDQWQNDGQPWTTIDWGQLAGSGPDWARTLVRALNTNLDLSEWWIINRQNQAGEIGGGLTDDVELVGLFGLMAYLLEGASDISLDGTIQLADGIWNSGIIDQARGFEAAYADVEHSAEPTGDSLHLYPMVRYGDPEGIERILKNTKTFDDLFLTPAGTGHRHFRGNHMSATAIGIEPAFRHDIPLNGRAVAPVPWLIWYSSNTGAESALSAWTDAWVADAARTDKAKPTGIFPNSLVTASEETGFPGGDWWSADPTYGQYSPFPDYQYFLYNLAAFFSLRTGAPQYREPFDRLAEYALEYAAAGSPALGPAPAAGQESLWCGGKLAPAVYGPLSSLANASGASSPSWNAYLDRYARSYASFLRDPTDAAPLQDILVPVAEELARTWPYRTTEGVMTDRIAVPGIGDVVSYYLGADVYSVYFGLPVQAVTWSGASRLFAAAVTASSRTALDATVYLFADTPRQVGLKFWGLEVGGDYVLELGPAPDLGRDPTSIAESVPFTLAHRGEGAAFTLPGRTVYAIRVRQISPGSATTPLLPDVAIAARDVTFDSTLDQLTVKVHNIGGADAPAIEVRAFEGTGTSGPVIGTVPGPALTAPNDLVPRAGDVTIAYAPASLPATITVALDPSDALAEVTEVNNGATVTIGGPSIPPAPMILQLEPASTLPGGSVTVTGRNFQPGVVALSSDAPTSLLNAAFSDPEHVALMVDAAAPELTYLLSLRNPDGKRSNLVPLPVGVPDTVPPAAVTGVKLSRVNLIDLHLEWLPVTLDQAGGPETVALYEVWRGDLPDFSDGVLWRTTSGISLDAAGEARAANGTHSYRVRARDAAGNLGP